MTEATTILQDQWPDTQANSGFSIDPSTILMNVIVAFLAPMFLGVVAGRIDFARLAAIETVNAYRARSHADLVSIAQIIGFGLAALGSLSLSMADNLSLSMTLRLRGNAVALNRGAEQNRRALQRSHADNPAPDHHPVPQPSAHDPLTPASKTSDADQNLDPAKLTGRIPAARQSATDIQAGCQTTQPAIDPAPVPAASPVTVPADPPELTVHQQNQLVWAKVMADEAAIMTADIPSLPPSEREQAEARAAALTKAANDLLAEINTRSENPAIPNHL